MLTITVPGVESWNKEKNEFEYSPETAIELEHSLASLSKWEEIFQKPFLAKGDRTDEEALGYIIAMTQTPDVPSEVYSRLSNQNLVDVAAYLNENRTATFFNTKGGGSTSQVLTSELIYYWMYECGIPKEHEHDHLSRLFTLLRVFAVERQPKTKTKATGEALTDRARLNAQRKAAMESSG